MNDGDAQDARKHIYTEAAKFGVVEEIMIPRPSSFAGTTGNDNGVGKIFVLFRETVCARKFQSQVNGRKFDGRVICAAFFPLERFQKGKYTLEDN